MSAPTQSRPNSIDPQAFAYFPVASFRCEERRSLTVHLEDAGWWDVVAAEGGEDPKPVHAGRYREFAAARAVADGLNRVWRACPGAVAAEIVAFVRRDVTVEDVEGAS